MSRQDPLKKLIRVMKKIHYKPDWKWEVRPSFIGDSIDLRLVWRVQDRNTGKWGPLTRTVVLSPSQIYGLTDRMIADFVWKCIKLQETHEAGEWFSFDGKYLHYPFEDHPNVDADKLGPAFNHKPRLRVIK